MNPVNRDAQLGFIEKNCGTIIVAENEAIIETLIKKIKEYFGITIDFLKERNKKTKISNISAKEKFMPLNIIDWWNRETRTKIQIQSKLYLSEETGSIKYLLRSFCWRL